MKCAFVAGVALLAFSAHADYIASEGQDSVRLTDKPCPAEVMALWPKQLAGEPRFASASIQGRNYPACWTLLNREAVLLQYLDGDQGLVPLSEFKKAPEA